MITTPGKEVYIPYVSNWLRKQLGCNQLFPGQAWHLSATILYADLHSFSTLSAAFARLPEGAEHLHAVSTLFFSTVISVVTTYSGDVVAIAGDALTIWWPDCLDVERARRCAEGMLAALSILPPIATPDGPFTLDLSIGVAAGPITVALVGLPASGVHLAMYGPALVAAIAAKNAVGHGQVHIAADDLVSCALHGIETKTDHSTTTPFPPSFAIAENALNLRHFLPAPFVERLRIGVLLAEYRRCVPVFAAFHLPTSVAALHDLIAQVQTIVSRWGGWLNEVEIGDKGSVLVILFGAPVAYDHDASRAVGCCLELRTRGLITHAGLTLGTLFVGAVGSPSRRVYTVQGDEMNLASHLMAAAAPDKILVSGRVQNETTGHYGFNAPALLRVKGHTEPVPVVEVTAGVKRYGRLHMGGEQIEIQGAIPLIGRLYERSVLHNAIEQVLAGQPQVVLVEGESGIGKSMLLQEVLAAWVARGFQAFSNECSSINQEMPGLAWQPILADLCGIDQVRPLATQRSQLAQILATLNLPWLSTPATRNSTSDRANEPSLMDILAHLLGIGDAEQHDDLMATVGMGMYAAESHMQIHTQMLELALAILQQHIACAPMLIMLEDIHWASSFSLEVMARLAALTQADHVPLLLLLSQRPLDRPVPQQISLIRNLTLTRRLVLSNLMPTECQELLAVLLGVEQVAPPLATLVYYQTHGQPLFIREFVRSLQEHHLVAIKQNVARLLYDTINLQVPDSVQGVIQARVDRLDEASQLTLKTAAVIGRTFRFTLLHTIHPTHPPRQELMDQLDQLIDLNLIEIEMEGPERVYRFKHKSTHEVAYASLLFGQRRILHVAVAQWYEQQYHEDIQTNRVARAVYETVAYHYGQAKEDIPQAYYCYLIARHAVQQYSNTTALEYIATALALTTDPDQRYALLCLRTTIYNRTGDRSEQVQDIAALWKLANQLDDPLRLAYVRYCHLGYLVSIGEFAYALADYQRTRWNIAKAARQFQSAHASYQAYLLRAACLDLQGQAYLAARDLENALAMHKRAFVLYHWVSANDPRFVSAEPTRDATESHIPDEVLNLPMLLARCLNNMGRIFLLLGDIGEASTCLHEALKCTQTSDNWTGEALALTLLSELACMHMNYTEAHRLSERALVISLATGERVMQADALRQLAVVKDLLGEPDEARRYALQGVTIGASTGSPVLDILMSKLPNP